VLGQRYKNAWDAVFNLRAHGVNDSVSIHMLTSDHALLSHSPTANAQDSSRPSEHNHWAVR